MITTELSTTAVAPWFGSNRMLAEHVGKELAGCEWVGVPFAGGMSELAHIDARTIAVNDLHRHVINLARVAAHPVKGPAMYRRLRRLPFHPGELAAAQERCKARGELRDDPDTLFASGFADPRFEGPDLDWAVDYFVSQWMNRSGNAGTDSEFRGGLPVRWNANGGDSAVRYASATSSLVAWRRILRRCNFTTLDCFDFLAKCKDAAGHGIYCDPPFPGPGDAYVNKFNEAHHRRLAAELSKFGAARVVVRYYHDHPLIRELYPTPMWTWVERVGRKQTNGDAPEVLILNDASFAEGGVA